MIRSIPQALTVSCLALLLPSSFSALTQDDERGLKPREYAEQLQKKFIRKRPQSKRPGPKAAAKYKPVTSDASIMPEGVDVGITFWRLREARKSDDQEVIEPKRIVKRIKGKEVVLSVKMTPTRATLETAFVDGEFLRLTLEVPFESYIYILNREEYAGGTMSDPYLVFPSETDLGQSAKGAPGRLIYIPNQARSRVSTAGANGWRNSPANSAR